MNKVIMPKLGVAQSYCLIEKWLKNEGDFIEKNEPLLEISTDKINFEVTSKYSGKLVKILRKEGEEVPVGEEIALIGDNGGTINDFS